MNRIDIGFVSDPLVEQPWTVLSLDFVQDNIKQLTAALANTFYPDAGGPTILYDCAFTDGGTSSTSYVNAGYIFDNNYEVCLVNPSSFTYSVGQVPILVRVISNDIVADPLIFTDGLPRNVHNHITYNVIAGATGSGDINYFDLKSIQNKKHTWNQVGNDSGATTFSTGWTGYSSGYGTASLSYTKNSDGLVTLRGIAKFGSTAGYQVFYLPVNYRPTCDIYIPIVNQSSPTGALQSLIRPTGEVRVFGTSPSTNDIISFSSIQFYNS